jgi:sodium-independent sulfate anion transporter 11
LKQKKMSLKTNYLILQISAPGQGVDTSQEIFALGSCQMVGSFVGSMPVTASIGRSAVNAASGVCSPFGGILTGLVSLFY